MTFTYFIITPGTVLDSWLAEPNNDEQFNYVKFGDQNNYDNGAEGLRLGYTTHNPDIGIAAIMDSTAIAASRLGTRLAAHLDGKPGVTRVGMTEWYAIETRRAWRVFIAMQRWDHKVITHANMGRVMKSIDKAFSIAVDDDSDDGGPDDLGDVTSFKGESGSGLIGDSLS